MSKLNRPAENVFWMSRRQKKVAILAIPIVICVWITLLFGFKREINYGTDETGYHYGGIYLANSMLRGKFIADALDENQFKYPGYYGFAAIIYTVFGKSHMILRAFGVIPLLLLPIIIANISSLLAGEKTRIFAYLTALFCPLFLCFSLLLMRDIYIIVAFSVILHALMVAINDDVNKIAIFFKPSVLVSIFIIYVMRTPQAVITIYIVVYCIINNISAKIKGKKKYVVWIFTVIMTLVIVYLYRHKLIGLMSLNLFDNNMNDVIYTTQYKMLAGYAFHSYDQMLSMLLNPRFLIPAVVFKLSSFFLGPHPFVRSESGASILDLFGGFTPEPWGGSEWIDVMLIFGLQWIEHFIMLSFVIAGLIWLWKMNRKGLLILFVFWIAYAIITLFVGNETRWGLPILVLYCVIPSVGYAWIGLSIKKYFFVSCYMFLIIVLVRYYVAPLPMLIIPFTLFVFMYKRLNKEGIRYRLAKE